MQKDIRLLIADDQQIVRHGIRACLSAYPHMRILSEACNGREAVQHATDMDIDVVLMDVSMPVMNGLKATEIIRRERPQTAVLAITVYTNPQYVLGIIACGARGYVLKDVSSAELARAVEALAGGKSFFGQEVSGIVVDNAMHQAPAGERGSPLSTREREVLKQVAEGCSTKEIASELGIAFRTAETHRERIMRKLDIHNVAGLTRYAIASGISQLE